MSNDNNAEHIDDFDKFDTPISVLAILTACLIVSFVIYAKVIQADDHADRIVSSWELKQEGSRLLFKCHFDGDPTPVMVEHVGLSSDQRARAMMHWVETEDQGHYVLIIPTGQFYQKIGPVDVEKFVKMYAGDNETHDNDEVATKSDK
jgi:hypothetical protein